MSDDWFVSPPREPGPQPVSGPSRPFVQNPRGTWTFPNEAAALAFANSCVSRLGARTRQPSSVVVVVETVYAARPVATIDAELAQLATANGGSPS